MNLYAEIEGIKYTPFLCRTLREYSLSDIEEAFRNDATFILSLEKDKRFAISWWFSPKRTMSYPYSRVYDSMAFLGKRVTIIPVFKDEGKDGDRDFIQWDTISLMSLLGVYVIVSYYKDADLNQRFKNKITKQRFDMEHIKNKLINLSSYQSDALHWNMNQIEKMPKIAEMALLSYKKMEDRLKVKFHSDRDIEKRIREVFNERGKFIDYSRYLAEKAQIRESRTIQPKERVSGNKALITIKNYLGGFYFLTCDEVVIQNDEVFLVECKHTKRKMFPSKADIKDGLIKMILFTNLKKLTINQRRFIPKAILKLTSTEIFEFRKVKNFSFLEGLQNESKNNNFLVFINDLNLENLLNRRSL